MDTTSFTLEDYNRLDSIRNSQSDLNQPLSNYKGKLRINFPPTRLTAVPATFPKTAGNSARTLRPDWGSVIMYLGYTFVMSVAILKTFLYELSTQT